MQDDRFNLELTGIAHGGEAFGFHQGKIYFVAYAMPGERVFVERIEEKKKWGRARLLEVLRPSPDRIEPPCQLFGLEGCGGCQWQYIRYERQLALKKEVVEDQLRRLGGVRQPPVKSTMRVSEPWGYRNSARFAVTSDGRTGFRRANSHEVIPVESCMLLHPRLTELYDLMETSWPGLQSLTLRVGVNTGEAMVILEVKGKGWPEIEVNVPVSIIIHTEKGYYPVIGSSYITEEVSGIRYRISAGSFFQVNTPGAERLVSLVKEFLDPAPGQRVLDAYSGVGLFGLALASDAAEVVGIEENSYAIEDMAQTAASLGMDNITLYEGPVEEVLQTLDDSVDLAVVDPPRGGLGKGVAAHLRRLGVRRLAYVSCDPATMARDTKALESQGYTLEMVQPVDLFPQTFHVETVALWVVKDKLDSAENRSESWA